MFQYSITTITNKQENNTNFNNNTNNNYQIQHGNTKIIFNKVFTIHNLFS